MLTSVILAIVLPLYTFAAGLIGIPYTLLTGRLAVSLLARSSRGANRLRPRAHPHRRRTGSEKIPDEPHFIYMMNHNSNLDAPAVFMQSSR